MLYPIELRAPRSILRQNRRAAHSRAYGGLKPTSFVNAGAATEMAALPRKYILQLSEKEKGPLPKSLGPFLLKVKLLVFSGGYIASPE